MLVEEGFARAKEYRPDTKYAKKLLELEDSARAQSLGGWAECGWV